MAGTQARFQALQLLKQRLLGSAKGLSMLELVGTDRPDKTENRILPLGLVSKVATWNYVLCT
jgi:hypothetical protein